MGEVGSVTLGRGKPLFPRRLTSPPLRLVSARQIGTGFAELRYEVPTSRDIADSWLGGASMKVNSILPKTGQAWKFKVAVFSSLLGGLAVAASRGMPRSSSNAWVVVDLAGIAIFFLGGLVFPSLSIRCPSCRARWFWLAISSKKLDVWLFWLLEAETCPRCPFPGES